MSMWVENNIPEGWVKSAIGELTYFVGEKISPTELTVYNYISTENLLSDKKGVDVSSNVPNVSKVNEFRIGDTLFSNIRTYFKKVWQANINGGSSNDVLIFRPLDESQLNKSYLYRIISSDLFIDFTVKTAKGTKMPRGDKNAMKLFQVALPPLQEQKAIAKVLTAFDDKIELLQDHNKTLETMAQTIFKEWFGKYQVGDELPEGWKFGCLGDVAVNNSKTFKFNDKRVVFINTGDVLEGEFLHKNEISPVGLPGQAKKAIELHDILYSEIRPKNKRFAFVNFDTSNYVVSTKFMIIKPQFGFSPFILYLILKNQATINEFNSIAESRSGTFPQITFDSIKDFPIVIPTNEYKQQFEEILKPIMSKQKANNDQLQSLTKTRDTLLPKLMSGQVRVKNIKHPADA